MDIKDVKVGMKVKLVSFENTDDKLGYGCQDMLAIGESGIVDEIFVEGEKNPHVSLDDGYYYDVLDLEPCLEDTLGKLTVSVSIEDKEEIAKDILKIVLQDFNVIISNAIESLSDGDLSEEKQPLPFEGYDMSDEKLHKLMDEVIKDVMRDSMREITSPSISMKTDSHVVTEDSVLTKLLNLIDKATADGDLVSLLNLTTAYQRMKNASTI